MQKSAAFSLFELMIALALIAGLLVLAASSLRDFFNQSRLTQHTNQLIAALHFARSEAIKTGSIVTFCKSSDHTTCGGQWRDGQIILIGNKVLRVYPALPPGEELFWKSSLGNNDSLRFASTGFTVGQKGSFYFCSADKKHNVRILIEQSGRVRVEKGDDCNGLDK